LEFLLKKLCYNAVYMTPKITHLSNNLPVLLLPMEGSESLTVMVLTNTGSRYEKTSQFGIAHFFEHIVFKGTKKYPDAQKLAATIDGLGAEFNAFTSNEYTGYYVKAAAKHVTTALDVVSDLLLQPRFKTSDIEREKGVIYEEMNMYVDSPARHISNLFNQMVFKDTGLGHDILGTKETVGSINQDDFEAFLQQWYGLPNMVLVLAGKASEVESSKLHKTVDEFFQKTYPKRIEERRSVESHLTDGSFAKRRLHLEKRETQQAHLVLGWQGFKRDDKDRFALAVAGALIGGNMSSRLFTEVREKRGLGYYVRSSVDQYHDTGIFGASAGVDPNRVEDAIAVIADEFYGIVNGKKPVTKEELKKTQEYLVGSTVLSMEDSSSVAQFYGLRQILSNKIETLEEVIEKIQAVTEDDVHNVVKRLVKESEMRLALIGPYEDKKRFEDLIQKF
jgi:predicted Zn-dependent peptidase